MAGKGSIGVWGASIDEQKALRRRRKILRYVDSFTFHSNGELSVGDYAARIFFIREDTPPSLREFTRQVEVVMSHTFVIGQVADFKSVRSSVQTVIDELVDYFEALQQQSRDGNLATGHPVGDALRTAMRMGFPGQSRPARSSGKAEEIGTNKDPKDMSSEP